MQPLRRSTTRYWHSHMRQFSFIRRQPGASPFATDSKQTTKQLDDGFQKTPSDQALEAKKSSKPPILDFSKRPIQKSGKKDGEDFHSSRYREASGETPTLGQFGAINSSSIQKKFFFNRNDTKSTSLYLDDINVVDIDNEETFHRVPRLEHMLDTVV